MKIPPLNSFVSLAPMLTVLCIATRAESAGQLAAKGHDAYHSGRYRESLAAYSKAAALAPGSPCLFFNLGDALYKTESYRKAGATFEHAARHSTDPVLMSRSLYNAGNCAFRQAEQEQARDLTAAITDCERSISQYEKALVGAPNFRPAVENLATAREFLQTLRTKAAEREKEQLKATQNTPKAPAGPARGEPKDNGSTQSTKSAPEAHRTGRVAPNQTRPGQGASTLQGSSPGGLPRGDRSPAQNASNAAPPSNAFQSPAASQQITANSQPGAMGAGQSFIQMQTAIQWPQAGLQRLPGVFGHGGVNPRGASSAPASNRPADILNEEKENRERMRGLLQTPGPAQVEKDW
jgi:tetratricopeptide (TPR) repeat protein